MPIPESIPDKQKISAIKFGDARVFGQDAPVRRRLEDNEALARFGEIWKTTLSNHVATALVITREEAEELLEEKLKWLAAAGYTYRQFSLYQVPFIARMTQGGYCDQLIALGAHRDPSRLCVHFDTTEAKDRFDQIARRLGFEPKALALELLTDFSRKLDRFD